MSTVLKYWFLRVILKSVAHKAWRFLWNDFSPRLIPDETLMAKAVELLGKNKEELDDILDGVYITDIKVNTNSGQEVLEKYSENNGEW